MANGTMSWRELVRIEMSHHDDINGIIGCTLSEESLDKQFGDGFGCSNGEPFTIWTERRVYFPVVYDGAEWVGSVPRNPCDEATPHQGGE